MGDLISFVMLVLFSIIGKWVGLSRTPALFGLFKSVKIAEYLSIFPFLIEHMGI